uniref:Uncharacterized protein n=1 Tax=Photinus pyralis TaxID=7054 RepID=A0A1Y1JZ71_PHOPY
MLCFDHVLLRITMYLNMGRNKSQTWAPCDVFNQEVSQNNYAVMVLNRPIPTEFSRNFVVNLWSKAVLRVTVDGGTNRWMSWLKSNNYDNKPDSYPDLVTGDMDSALSEVVEYFCKQNAELKVVPTPNQNETDFTKALREVHKHALDRNLKIDTVFVMIESSGRFDQIVGNINTLFKAHSIIPNVNVFLLSGNSLTWLLRSNIVHSITIPLELRNKHRWCGLIPIGRPCVVTTTGLKWNLSKSGMLCVPTNLSCCAFR